MNSRQEALKQQREMRRQKNELHRACFIRMRQQGRTMAEISQTLGINMKKLQQWAHAEGLLRPRAGRPRG